MKVLQQELQRLSPPKALGWALPNEADTGLDQFGWIKIPRNLYQSVVGQLWGLGTKLGKELKGETSTLTAEWSGEPFISTA
jgi:hypothetical protein